MEAEEHFGFEEVAARRALEELYRPYEKNLDFMRTVQNGAFLLVDEQRAEQASYRELVVLRHATERLLRVVDTSMHSVIQRERHAARRELASAQRARQEAEVRQQRCGRLERELGEERSQHAAVAALLVGAILTPPWAGYPFFPDSSVLVQPTLVHFRSTLA
ncbi:unnamed protein product [Closterium sp. NIES-65]|nr:unnamed protein product [Closterium sp. NIES-65]CAI5959046.1 unnamed protein product [Closterium sp. NIES-65]